MTSSLITTYLIVHHLLCLESNSASHAVAWNISTNIFISSLSIYQITFHAETAGTMRHRACFYYYYFTEIWYFDYNNKMLQHLNIQKTLPWNSVCNLMSLLRKNKSILEKHMFLILKRIVFYICTICQQRAEAFFKLGVPPHEKKMAPKVFLNKLRSI